MGLTGVNDEVTVTCLNGVKSAYNDVMSTITNGIQNTFVNNMGQCWAAPLAQEQFANIKEVLDAKFSEIDSQVQNFMDVINWAAREWAEKQHYSHQNISFEPRGLKLNVSAILENIGGVRGIDKDIATTEVGKLPGVVAEINEGFNKMCTAVQSSGFMGDGQEEQLVSSIKSINQKITDSINNISSDIKSAITETVNLYGDTAGKIKESFAEH